MSKSLSAAKLKEVEDLLTDALLFLEFYGDGTYDDAQLAFAGHSITQRALFILSGDDAPPQITEYAQFVLSNEAAKSALQNAMDIKGVYMGPSTGKDRQVI